MITAASKANKTSISPTDLITFFIEEAQHRVIEGERATQADAALVARTSGKTRKPRKTRNGVHKPTDVVCDNPNCGKSRHTKANCWEKGGGKEGQGPWTSASKPVKKTGSPTAAVAKDEYLFAFSCTSDFSNATDDLEFPKSTLGAIVDSGASCHFSLDRWKFKNYRAISDKPITTADGRTFKAIGMGDVPIDLPNGKGRTKAVLKNSIYSPNLAFTLISINALDEANCEASFKNGWCTIKNPNGKTMATIPKSNGLYRILDQDVDTHVDYANIASTKMTITEAHRRLGHISPKAIRHMVQTGMITGIDLDLESKPDFCESCVKAKSNRLPFLRESET
jgi:hypothetical protein